MSALRLAFRGTLAALDAPTRAALFDRGTATDPTLRARVRDGVRDMIDDMRRQGDVALHRFARDLDGVTLESLEVSRARRRTALDAIDPELRRVMERAVRNLRDVHAAFLPSACEIVTIDGAIIGRRPDPLARVGVYAPGGRAAYPSSVLMGTVPAKVAGVGEILLCSPPNQDGAPSDVVLAAAELAGVDRVFAVGGAGAIAALAYGTATIPAVDRIVGPGNAYVAEAKAQVASLVSIDAPAGPSELLVIADGDGDAPADTIAGEVLAQAEHDPQAAVILLTDSPSVERDVYAALLRRIDAEPRAAIIGESLALHGASIVVDTLDDAIEFSNAWAPEHLLLAVRPERQPAMLDRVRNAGTVFVGVSASVVFGDYLSGANHVLPTGGAARSYSGLSTLDFIRWTSWQRIAPEAAARLADDAGRFADAEGLSAHAAAARHWRST